ncbi:single-stranded DNA-binding protein [bacterium]|jgi:single-stranded DNA-binding protein|nr:single-stranded DNA-binding protein [bacterium]
MSIAKATVTGTVYRAPEKRFTQNNIAVSAFVVNIGEKDEVLLRVISKRTSLDELVSTLNKNDRVLVEGRLQTNTVKMDDGSEKRIYEIDANTIEKISGSAPSNADFSSEEIVKFESDEISNELINEDEIPF